MSNSKDYYQILRVDRNATQEEIKHKYNMYVFILHPDRLMNLSSHIRSMAEAELTNINEAYAVLKDPTQRAQYDLEYDKNKENDEEYELFITKLKETYESEKNQLEKSHLNRKKILKIMAVCLIIVIVFAAHFWTETNYLVRETKQLSSDIVSKNNDIDSLNTQLSQKNDEINSLSGDILSKNEQINGLNSSIDSLNNNIYNLNAQLSSKNEQINGLNSSIDSLNNEIYNLNVQLTSKNNQINSLAERVTSLNNDIYNLTAQLSR